MAITGAGSGLAQLGATLALSGGQSGDIDRETKKLLQTGAEAGTYPLLDITTREAVFRHAAGLQRDFGAVHFIFNPVRTGGRACGRR